jgi:hypothetical protein
VDLRQITFLLQATEANTPFRELCPRSQEMGASWPTSPDKEDSPKKFMMYTRSPTTEPETMLSGLRLCIFEPCLSFTSSLHMLENKRSHFTELLAEYLTGT